MIPFSENLLQLGEKMPRRTKLTVVVVPVGDSGDGAEMLLVLKVGQLSRCLGCCYKIYIQVPAT